MTHARVPDTRICQWKNLSVPENHGGTVRVLKRYDPWLPNSETADGNSEAVLGAVPMAPHLPGRISTYAPDRGRSPGLPEVATMRAPAQS